MPTATRRLLHLHRDDQVAVTPDPLAPGDPLPSPDGGDRVRDDVPAGHKVAVRAVAAGDPVRKYGEVIGTATAAIAVGEHVHTHNLGAVHEHASVGGSRRAGPASVAAPPRPATFSGIVRPDGRVATRNYLAVLTSVNCSATAARLIADQFRAPGALDGYPGIDGVVALTHTGGCGLHGGGEGHALLQRTIGGYARHPNVAGFLVVGLGCEVNQIPDLLAAEGLSAGPLAQPMTIQEEGGTARTVARGVDALREMLPDAARVERREVSAEHLVLGLQCGGSDAHSGLTANPALGAASDLLVAAGGTSVLGETPEVYGAEHLLLERAASPAVADRLRARIAWWEAYAARNDAELDSNPSPGNRAGGITTISEKSLGAVAKAGHSPLQAVVEYAEPVPRGGLVFMDTPGYDPVSVTGMVAGGANVVAFTTGRGSVFGCKPVPSVKVATTSDLYRRMRDDMDFDAGVSADGTATLDEVGHDLFRLLLDTASGRRTASEELGVGQDEFAPWQLGATF